MKKQPIEDFERTDQSTRVLRGGSGIDYDGTAPVSVRGRLDPPYRYNNIGFRVVRNKDPKK